MSAPRGDEHGRHRRDAPWRDGLRSRGKGLPTSRPSTENADFLLRHAILAPSSHNTQPWSFDVHDNRLEVHADLTRWLRVADADRRELHVSLGCAIENLVLAAEYVGLAPVCASFPTAPARSTWSRCTSLVVHSKPVHRVPWSCSRPSPRAIILASARQSPGITGREVDGPAAAVAAAGDAVERAEAAAERGERAEAVDRAENAESTERDLLTERDLAHLPDPVRRYVLRSGFVGRPKVRAFRRWHPDGAEPYAYLEFELVDLEVIG